MIFRPLSTSTEVWTIWGACTITNGTTGYRTLTNTEWQYLFDNHTYGLHVVHGNTGIIILPDGMSSATGFISGLSSWSSVSPENWAAMEAAGAVFLPAAGFRDNSTLNSVGDIGIYWTSVSNEDRAYYLFFTYGAVTLSNDGSKGTGMSVRLVKDAN